MIAFDGPVTMRRNIAIIILTALAILAATGVATADVTIGQDKSTRARLTYIEA